MNSNDLGYDKKDPAIYPLAFYVDEGPHWRTYALYFKPDHALFYKIDDRDGEVTDFKHNIDPAVDPNAWANNKHITAAQFWSNLL